MGMSTLYASPARSPDVFVPSCNPVVKGRLQWNRGRDPASLSPFFIPPAILEFRGGTWHFLFQPACFPNLGHALALHFQDALPSHLPPVLHLLTRFFAFNRPSCPLVIFFLAKLRCSFEASGLLQEYSNSLRASSYSSSAATSKVSTANLIPTSAPSLHACDIRPRYVWKRIPFYGMKIGPENDETSCQRQLTLNSREPCFSFPWHLVPANLQKRRFDLFPPSFIDFLPRATRQLDIRLSAPSQLCSTCPTL
jgi:hypothetical protein